MDRLRSYAYFKDLKTNPDSVNNLKYLAEDLGAIAHGLDRTDADPENLNWVLKKLAENPGIGQKMDGKLAEVAAMAKILKVAGDETNIQLGRNLWHDIPGAGKLETNMDVVEQVNKIFYEVKTTAVAAAEKLAKNQASALPNISQVANEAYSQVVLKMIIHQRVNPGKRFELWADTSGNPEALKTAVVAAIEKFADKKVIDASMKKLLLEDFHVVDHARRYKLGV